MSSEIQRFDSNARMSRIVIHNGIVYLSGQTPSADKVGIEDQTRDVLAKIDQSLAKAGTDKSRLLTAQIWLSDIGRDFDGMNAVWSNWLDKNGIPTRATGQVQLARPELLVEITVSAAL